ncbi:DUF3105 domain-containing protein [Antrihabitans sp. YC2-6]|uniref:DUF3105 domain-containing protein n=1 Tax=Antrihabitans sp. YC2-6 TaxID=2799498 RepID=UPI0018F6EE35|nr:DUF3105 domain-containing protein [Antrihabitans sp. YC2-6]MBJ8348192.1 DUF3105 domain-containing protein [Antrihabitans sp. YC2-6]
MPSGSDSRSPVSKTGAKSAKAIKAATKKKKGVPAGKGLPKTRQIPWMTVGAVAVVVALIGLLAWNIFPKYLEKRDAERFSPTAENIDPSTGIDGVERLEFKGSLHIQPGQRVAYKQTPPIGGPHDQVWAACNGFVYPTAIRTENAVHSLEHGAVWITYNPDKVDSETIETLGDKFVDGKPYTFMSPYPGQDSPISLQAWGHQLKIDNADDRRIGQFIAALRQNPYEDSFLFPEKRASCDASPGAFDPDNPPPFDTSPLPADAVQPDDPNLQPDPIEQPGIPGMPGLPGDPSIPGLPGLPGDPNAPVVPPGGDAPPALDPNAPPAVPAPPQ